MMTDQPMPPMFLTVQEGNNTDTDMTIKFRAVDGNNYPVKLSGQLLGPLVTMINGLSNRMPKGGAIGNEVASQPLKAIGSQTLGQPDRVALSILLEGGLRLTLSIDTPDVLESLQRDLGLIATFLNQKKSGRVN